MKKKQINGVSCALPLAVAMIAVSASSGFCASPAYPSVVKGDGALGYYRLNDSLTRTLVNVNSGTLGAAGNATNDLSTFTGGVVYSMPGAIVGDPNRAAFYDFTTRTEVPWNAALNPPNTQPFSVEAWIYAVNDQVGNGMGVLVNRLKPSDGTRERVGSCINALLIQTIASLAALAWAGISKCITVWTGARIYKSRVRTQLLLANGNITWSFTILCRSPMPP